MADWDRLLSGCRELNLDRGFESLPPRSCRTAAVRQRSFFGKFPVTWVEYQRNFSRGLIIMALPKKSRIIQDYLTQFGLRLEVLEFEESTKTAQEAANAIGCEIGQIVKSLIFKHKDQALLFLVSGKNNLDVNKVCRDQKLDLKKADADYVKAVTGFAIGGVPPIAHARPLDTFIDQDLLGYQDVWAAAGTPNAVFRLESRTLQPLTNGQVIKVC